MADWSLTSLQLKLIKIGARVVRHARAITFQLAEVAVTGPMVRAIPRRHPPIASATAMRVTALSRPKLNESGATGPFAALKNVAAGKRRCPVRGPIHPAPVVCATAEDAAPRGEKRLFQRAKSAILTSDGRPLGECRLKRHHLVLDRKVLHGQKFHTQPPHDRDHEVPYGRGPLRRATRASLRYLPDAR